MNRIIGLFFCIFVGLSTSFVCGANNFVIAAVDMPQELDDYLNQTATSLAKQTGKTIQIKKVDDKKFEQGIKYNEFSAFFIPSFLYRKVPSYGLQGIAVLTTGRSTHPNVTIGASVFFNSVYNNYRHLKDIRAAKIGVLKRDNYSRHLVESDIIGTVEADNRLWQMVLESDIYGLLKALYFNEIDVIILPSCYLEDHSALLEDLDTSWLLPVEEKAHSSMACFHSTTLLPGMVFGLSTQSSPEELITVSQILLNHPKGVRGEKWKVANDFRSVDMALQRLELDEAASLRKPSLTRFVELYRPYIWAVFLIVIFLTLNSSILTFLVKKRTNQLQQALREQQELKERAKGALSRLEKIQKLSVLGQLGSLFAHELRQPLNAISCYSYTLQKILEKQKAMEETTLAAESIKNIQSQTQRISIIIEKVRDYIRHKSRSRELCQLQSIIRSAISTFETTVVSEKKLKFSIFFPKEAVFIKADSVELELVLVNLFRNSVEAQTVGKTCEIAVNLETINEFSVVTVSDNGPVLSDSLFDKISSQRTSSAKPQGLGLGLAIVRFLVENNKGTISFKKNPKGGLIVEIKMPLVKKD